MRTGEAVRCCCRLVCCRVGKDVAEERLCRRKAARARVSYLLGSMTQVKGTIQLGQVRQGAAVGGLAGMVLAFLTSMVHSTRFPSPRRLLRRPNSAHQLEVSIIQPCVCCSTCALCVRTCCLQGQEAA